MLGYETPDAILEENKNKLFSKDLYNKLKTDANLSFLTSQERENRELEAKQWLERVSCVLPTPEDDEEQNGLGAARTGTKASLSTLNALLSDARG